MGVKVSDLLEESARASVLVAGHQVDVEYFVLWEERFSSEDWERIQELSGREYLLEVLPRLLKSWDLTDGKGKPIPVTAEAIAEHSVPTRFLRLTERAVLEDPKGSAASSPATSQPTAS